MAFVTGEVVPSDDSELPFKVVFKQGEEVLSEWLVESQEDGEAQIIEAIRSLSEDEEDEEEGEEDDDEDGDDDQDNDDDDDDDDDKDKSKRR